MPAYLQDLSLGFTLPYIISLFFTTLNIIDGFNGLASGICLLILCAIAYVAYDGKCFFRYGANLTSENNLP